MNIFNDLKDIISSSPFIKEFILVVSSVVLGGIITVSINIGAMHKQSKYNMQHQIIKNLFNDVNVLLKAINSLEIQISFANRNASEFKGDIDHIEKLALQLNEQMRNQRKFVRKFLKASTVELSAQVVFDFHEIFYYFGADGLTDIRLIDEIDNNTICSLREAISHVHIINNEITETLECFISPGLFPIIKRKLRKPYMFLEEFFGMIKVKKQKRKIEKKKSKGNIRIN